MNWTSMGLFCLLSVVSQAARAGSSIEISRVSDQATATTIELVSQSDGQIFHVEKSPLFKTGDFVHAMAPGNSDPVVLSIDLKTEAAARLKRFSAENLGRRMAFVVNGRLLQAPVIRDVIRGPGVQVGPFDRVDADRLVQAINGS